MAQESMQLLTQIAVSSHLPVTGKVIVDQFKKLFPAYLEKLPVEAFEPQKAGDAIRIILGANAETGIDVLALPEPIPPAMLTFAYATNAHWPDARTELQRSRAHIAVIGLQRKDGKDDPIRNAICLTLVTACLCNLVPAIGVFCPSGNALTPVRRLRELATGMLTGEPPVEAWVQTMFTDAPAEGGKRRLFAMTNGLRALMGREIEIQPTARDRESLAQAVHLLLRFAMQRGAAFDEGDSVKLKDGDVACVRYADQGQRSDIPIFETRLAKLDEQGKLPPDAFGDKPLPPKAPPRDPAAGLAAGPAEPVRPEEKIFVAHVLLARPTPISAQMLTAAIRRRFPEFKGEYQNVGERESENQSGNSQMFLMRGTPIAIMAIDLPIPAPNFANAIAAAEIVWPDAAKTIAQHQAHLVIGNIASADGFSDATRRAGDLTILVAALCDIVPAIAVHWAAGDTIIKPADFQNCANQYLARTPPVDSWLQLRLIRATTEPAKPAPSNDASRLVRNLRRPQT